MPFWRKFLGGKPDYGGAPQLGRRKSYSAESGYVYEYKLASFRNDRRGADGTYEYTFEISGGPRDLKQMVIVLRESVLGEWSARRGVDVSASERYGVAKIALKRTLDSSTSPKSLPDTLMPDVIELEAIGEFLRL